MKYFWYALTVPLRVVVIFVCALVLVASICLLSVFQGDLK